MSGSSQLRIGARCVLLVYLFCQLLRGDSATSASFSATIVDAAGLPVDRVAATLTHTPTGWVNQTVTGAAGILVFSGLPVGGPYDLTLRGPAGHVHRITNIHLTLDAPRHQRVILDRSPGDVVALEPWIVVAEPDSSTGPTIVSVEEKARTPSLEDDLTDFAALDPKVVLIDVERGELAAGGQNARFNSIAIDGMRLHDLFGLSPNGFPSQGNPISVETLEAIAIDLAPFDVARGGFTGADINAVTRSGSNRLGGSLHYRFRNQRLQAPHALTGKRQPFAQRNYGLTIGGPVVRNRLFYFLGYERAEREEPAPSPGFAPSAAAIDRIIAIAASYGHDAGRLESPGQNENGNDKYLAKLDWHVSADHRVSVRYSENRGREPVFVDYSTPERISLSNHWYDSVQVLRAWSGQAFSRWGQRLETDLKWASHRHDSKREPRSRFPQVRVNGVPNQEGTDTGSVFLGTDDASQKNALGVKADEWGAILTWSYARHRFRLGAQYETSEFTNTFLQNAYGSYSFSSVENFAVGAPSAFTYQYPLAGDDATVEWGYGMAALFAEDAWRVHPQLELTAGVRFDYPVIDQAPPYNAAFHQAFGRRNDEVLAGSYVAGPRASFKAELGRRRPVRLRGGAGVFQGRAPGVWLSNAYSNDGRSSAVNTSIPRFSPDPEQQPPGNPATRRQRVDLLEAGLRWPAILRGTFALERRIGWREVIASAEVMQTWTLSGLTYQNINLRRVGTGPDGRAIYGDRTAAGSVVSNSYYLHGGYSDVYLLRNTGRGDATQVTVALRRTLRGRWGGHISYTRSAAREVSPMTSSTAGTNFSTRASLDPNAAELGVSNTLVRDRILASGTVRLNPRRPWETRFTVAYEGRSGRPYSFIFGSDVNGDSADNLNDLFYVPTGPGDPSVRWANPAQEEAFYAYLANNPRLRRWAGRVVPRNSERSPFQHRVDLKLSQAIPLRGRFSAEVFADLINALSLLNPAWGRVYQVNFPYGLVIANASYDANNRQYLYRYSGARSPTLQPSLSRWQAQAGVRLRF